MQPTVIPSPVPHHSGSQPRPASLRRVILWSSVLGALCVGTLVVGLASAARWRGQGDDASVDPSSWEEPSAEDTIPTVKTIRPKRNPLFVRAVEAIAVMHGPFVAAVGHSLGAASLGIALRRGLRLGRVVFISSPASLNEHAHHFALLDEHRDIIHHFPAAIGLGELLRL